MAAFRDRRFGAGWLIAAALVQPVLWNIPYGQYALYPFSVMGTWFHEMGHGLTALLLGGSFVRLELFSSGGGLATCGTSGGRIASALVSAGGLMGPPVAGFLFLVAAARGWTTRVALWALGGLILLSVLVWVRTLFGIVAMSLIGASFLFAARRTSLEAQALLVRLIGVQACVSGYRSRGYMFSSEAHVDGATLGSDTANIASQLFLPVPFWGALLFVLTLAIFGAGIYYSVRLGKSSQ